MPKALFSILFLFSFIISSAQIRNSDTLTIAAKIIDKVNNEAIPYATVFNISRSRGSISNLEGLFSLDMVSMGDTVVISFIGYKKQTIVIRELGIDSIVLLERKTELLNEVHIYGDNSYLYNLISKCRKTQSNGSKTARTYFVLKSSIDSGQVELLEGYYNGSYSGYDVNYLEFKNGRIALSKFDDRFFTSMASSRALYMHKLFETNQYFPKSPFQLSKKNLKTVYNLSAKSKYLDDNLNTIYVIGFIPKDSTKEYFKGKVWIDSSTTRIVKINLQFNNALVHPFEGLGKIDSLLKVDMYISKTYEDVKGKMYVKSIDFNYQIGYKTRANVNGSQKKEKYTVSTDVVMYAYDYKDQFLLPFFEYPNDMYIDYRQISASPYNHFFWNNIQEFGMSTLKEVKDSNEGYHSNNSSINSKSLFEENYYWKKGFFEHPYVFWSKKRIIIKGKELDTNNLNPHTFASRSDLYNLEVQVYVDINELNDSLNIMSATTFDPFKTFYPFTMTGESLAFINMYFDLMEIGRRELEEELYKRGSSKHIKFFSDEKKKEIETRGQTFLREVQRGTNKVAMLKWNALILRKIGIDNVWTFHLYQDE